MENEKLKEIETVNEEVKKVEAGASSLSLQVQSAYTPTIWNDTSMLEKAWKSAQFLAKTDIVPDTFKKPENCLIALDIANRTGMQPLTVMQNLYIVKGKPTWSGQMCIALINNSGRFTPLEFQFVGEIGTDSHGCFATAKRLDTGAVCCSDIITIGVAKKEGWYNKDGSKWKTIPIQMMMYRAGAFFGRVHCPDVLMGLPLSDEIRDVYGYTEATTKQSIMQALDGEEE